MIIATDDIVYQFGNLVSVHYLSIDEEINWISAIKLTFENGVVYNEAVGATDEIVLTNKLNDHYQIITAANDITPWAEAIGRPTLWLWNLTNQQGYNDGVQYAFAAPRQNEIIIQLMVEASSIKLYQMASMDDGKS